MQPFTSHRRRTHSCRARSVLAASITRAITLANNLIRSERGSTAVEFGLVAFPLVAAILFILTVGLILFLTQTLDYATNKAARQIMLGAVQKTNMTQSGFQAQVCSYLPAIFNCSSVIVNVQNVTQAAQPGGYYTFVNAGQTALIMPALSNASAQFSPGVQGSYEYVQVLYPITFLPSFFSSLFGTATYNGSSAYVIVSTAAFRNEQY